MSISAPHIYEQLADAPDDKTCARIIAEAIEDLYLQLKEVTTQPQMRETVLPFQKKIKEVELCQAHETQVLDLKIAENTSKIAESKSELIPRMVWCRAVANHIIHWRTAQRVAQLI